MSTLKLYESSEKESTKKSIIKNERLSHIKKEKSRDAARSRRGRENCEFYALATLLPIPDETSSQLDKASIIRLTMSFLQLRQLLFNKNIALPTSKNTDFRNCSSNLHLSVALQSLDGFLVVINSNGRCLYVSNSISEDLGLAQVDLIGSNIFNVVLPSDHKEFQMHLNSDCCEHSKKFCRATSCKSSKSSNCSFFVRMKSTQTKRALGIKSSGYKVVHFTGHTFSNYPSASDSPSNDGDVNQNGDTDEEPSTFSGFTGLVRVLSHTPVELSIDELVFVVRTDQSLLMTYCDEQIKLLSDYDVDDLKGRTIYQFIHTSDLDKIRTCHTEMLDKGHIVTPLYRWLLKDGGFMWVQSRAGALQEKSHVFETDHSYAWITYVITNLSELDSNGLVCSATASNGEEKVKTEPTKKPACPKLNETFRRHSLADMSSHAKQQTSPSLKRTRSDDVYESVRQQDSNLKREKKTVDNPINSPALTLDASDDSGSIPSKDVLDVNSTKWGNPPNREVASHSDLYATVIHHYPHGINPNLLSSNPVFAKMLTTNYVTYESLAQRDAFLLPPPTVNLFSPVLGAIPHLVPNQPAKLAYCPPSIASIVDELRQDPMRKVNPPNKVVLSRSQIPHQDQAKSVDKAASVSSVPAFLSPLNPHLLTISNVSSENLVLTSLAGVEGESSSSTVFLHPIELAHKVNSLNSLHI